MSKIPLPTAVDVTPVAGRRVRTQDGSLLPENHILRGEPRSAYWLRLERDGDVTLKPHEPQVAEAAAGDPPTAEDAAAEPAAGDAPASGFGRKPKP